MPYSEPHEVLVGREYGDKDRDIDRDMGTVHMPLSGHPNIGAEGTGLEDTLEVWTENGGFEVHT